MTRSKSNTDARLCECGCGSQTTYHKGKWRRFRSGHNAALRKGPLNPGWIDKPIRLCECGCGKNAARGKRFIRFHANRLRRGTKNPNWVGGQVKTTRGHILVLAPGHPRSDGAGYALRSHLVAEEKLGRLLAPGEVVHHLNRDKTDDHPENLEVMSHGEHTALHHREDARRVASGERCGQSKLKGAAVEELRKLAEAGQIERGYGSHVGSTKLNISQLSRRFGVHRATIRRALDGLTWKQERER